MKLIIKSGSPDGISVTYKTYLMTWEELQKFLEVVAQIESGELLKENQK